MTDTNQPGRPNEGVQPGASASEVLRAQMPIVDRFAYFDHAAVAPLPTATADAIAQYANQARDLGDTPWMDWSQRIESLRDQAAELVGASRGEIALVPNTTTGIGLVAEGWPWRPGDSVVVPTNEFPSNLAPWRHLARRGVEVREVPLPSDQAGVARLTVDAILDAMDSTTRLVTLSWVGFVSGWRIDVAEFSRAVHKRGALLFLDAIQGLGAFPLNVREAEVDFCAADGHKWMLGPEGAGVLYIAARHLERLDPLLVGWHSLDERSAFDPDNRRFKPTAERYEGGSANIAGLLGLERSIHLLLACGSHRNDSGLSEAVLRNVDELVEQLTRVGCTVHVPGDRGHRSGILTLSWPDARGQREPAAARRFCLTQGIVTSVRAGRLRISTHAYNNSDDIARLSDALGDFLSR